MATLGTEVSGFCGCEKTFCEEELLQLSDQKFHNEVKCLESGP